MAGNIDLAKLVVKMEAQSAGYLRDLEKQKTATKKWQSKVSGHVGKVSKAFRGLAIAAGIAVLTKKIVANTAKQEQAIAQLTAGFKSMGGVVGHTVDSMIKKAGELQNVSLFGDEQIIEAQSQLVTFGKITGDVFDRALMSAMDLSTRLGKDLKSSVLQLGKALNDPILGLSALTESGVSFDESQKEIIKTLVKSGRAVEAQKLMLTELEREFKGSAAAARDTFGGAITGLSNAFGDLLEGGAGGKGGVNETKDAIEELTSMLQDPEFVAGTQRFLSAAITGFTTLAGLIAKSAEGWGMIYDLAKKGVNSAGEWAADFIGASSPEYREQQKNNGFIGPIWAGQGEPSAALQGAPVKPADDIMDYNFGGDDGLDEDLKAYIAQLAAKHDAALEFAQTEERIAKETQSMKFGLASQALDMIASTAKEGSAIQRAALIASKVLSVAQILMNTEVAATSALLPPPIGLGPVAGLGYAATIRTLGYMSAGLVAGQAIASFEGGGYTGDGPRSGGIDGRGGMLSLVHPQESIFDHTKNQGGVTVNLIEDASRAGQVTQSQTDEGTRIDIAVSTLLDRGNNRTTRALENRYPNNRRRGT